MKTAIKIENLTVSYSSTDAINNINLTVSNGEFINIVGPNGGGKTTLIKAILGLIKPDNGKIAVLNESVKKGKTLIGYVPQKAEAEKDFPITVVEAVETAFLKTGLNPFKKVSTEERSKSLELLKLLGLEHLAHRQINQLSGGEFQRLLIARALARDPKILLLDEPTANIDPLSAKKIYEILDKLNLEGRTVIMVSHDLNYVLSSAKRTVFIDRDILFDGTATNEIFKF